MISMSVFSVGVLVVIASGCSIGLYNKYKYSDPGYQADRPRSRTGTIDSRRSTGSRRSNESKRSNDSNYSSGSRASRSSRRSRRYKEKENGESIYTEIRNKPKLERVDEVLVEATPEVWRRPHVLEQSSSLSKKRSRNTQTGKDENEGIEQASDEVTPNIVDHNEISINFLPCKNKEARISLSNVTPSSAPVYLNELDLFHKHRSWHLEGCVPDVSISTKTPTQQRQEVSLNSFRTGTRSLTRNDGRRSDHMKDSVVFASTESLNNYNDKACDDTRRNSRKIRFNPYNEFSA